MKGGHTDVIQTPEKSGRAAPESHHQYLRSEHADRLEADGIADMGNPMDRRAVFEQMKRKLGVKVPQYLEIEMP